MKKQINLSIHYILSFVLFFVGIISLFTAMSRHDLISNPYSWDNLNSITFDTGDYICGDISKYLVNTGSNGVMGETGDMFGFYTIYSVPTEDNKYIELLIKDEEILAKLETYEAGVGSGVYLEAKIIKGDSAYLNYPFYQRALNTDSTELIDQLTVAELNIIETDFSSNFTLFIIAAFSLFAGVSLFFFSGGVAGFVQDRTITTSFSYSDKSTLATATIYPEEAYKNLVRERDKLRTLSKKRDKIYNGIIFGAIYLVLGTIPYFVINSLIEGESAEYVANIGFLLQALFILGIIFIIIGVKKLLRAFINSDWEIAIKISEILQLNTIRTQIENRERVIMSLERIVRDNPNGMG